MSCNFDQLKTLLRDKGYPEAAEHAESIRWKLVQARYYSKLSKEKDFSGFLATFTGNELLGHDPQLQDSLLQCEAHTMCLAQIVHSLGDLTGQLVNKSVLQREGRQIQREVFYLSNVVQELDRANVAACTEISDLLKDFKDSTEFQYLTAFVNTIKHRSLVDSDQAGHYSVTGDNHEGLRFKEFEYKSDTFDAVFAEVIYQNYLDTLEQYLCAVVEKLIEVMT